MARHYTRNQIIAQCKAIAREKRMANRSPWTAMGIVCGYTLLTSEGFKGQRIAKICAKVDEYENLYDEGKLTVKEVQDALMEKAEWSVECKEYTEANITARKGSFQYWLDSIQIEPQNRINETATRYLLFFFRALNELHGYGKDRLTRVQESLNKTIDEYKDNKDAITKWKTALLEDAGIYFENPIDPLTQEKGSMMCGGYGNGY